MVDHIFQSNNLELAQKLLDAASLRQQAIASNIANAETPGYKRIDLTPDFERQLKAQVDSGNFSGSLDAIQPQLAEDRTARSIRPDGNNVQVEKELLELDRNGVNYNYLSDYVSTNLKQLKIAISGNVS